MPVSIGCSGNGTCIDVLNVSGSTIQFRNNSTKVVYSPRLKTSTTTTILVSPDLKIGSLSIVTTGGTVLNSHFPQEGQGEAVVTQANFERPGQTRHKLFSYWVAIAAFVVAAILAFALGSQLNKNAEEVYCQEQNLTQEECQEQAQLGQLPKPGGRIGLFVVGGISIAIALALVVFWIYAEGPKGYASYGVCKQRDKFASTWKWVMPRSGLRKFLCQVFGSCECAADELNMKCLIHSVKTDSLYGWDSVGAAKSKSSSDVCFCCAEGTSVCYDVVKNKTCNKK